MKFCIISDIHCTTVKGGSNLMYSGIPDKPITQNPITSFLKILKEDEDVLSDALLCLGDLGDKASESGIKTAWDSLERIKSEMNCDFKIGIPGNHDVDSRNMNSEDPFSYIQKFSTEFPTSDKNLNMKFWHNGYCLYETEEFEILMVNSVWNHKNAENAKTSVLDQSVLEELDDELELSLNKIKICLLHHHPVKHSDINNWKDSDSVDNGDKLLSVLNKYNFHILIHGHKHQPRVLDRNGLTVFATGSFSSFENLSNTGINTMFHVLDISLKDNGKGKIHSWEFNLHRGWKKNLNDNFPPEIGFGGNINETETAKKINNLFTDTSVILYDEVLKGIPELEYIIPERLIKLNNILKSQYSLFSYPEYPLTPRTITKK